MWLRERGTARFLIVLCGGDLEWDSAANGFASHSTAVSPTLASAFDEEPRWIDLRWYGSSAGTQDGRFEQRVADLAAAILEKTETISQASMSANICEQCAYCVAALVPFQS